MKSIKLLLKSSTITLISALLIQPVIAKPTMTVQALNVNSAQVSASKQSLQLTSFVSLPSNPVKNMLNQYENNIDTTFSYNVSSRLALSSVRKTAEEMPTRHTGNINNGNSFFETAMIFNDKMQQVISYFKNHNNSLTQPKNSLQESHQAEIKNLQKECNA